MQFQRSHVYTSFQTYSSSQANKVRQPHKSAKSDTMKPEISTLNYRKVLTSYTLNYIKVLLIKWQYS